jgi:hypothetical protein
MMDPSFPSFMIDELRALLSQIEGCREPENDELYKAVMQTLRPQYDEFVSALPRPDREAGK